MQSWKNLCLLTTVNPINSGGLEYFGSGDNRQNWPLGRTDRVGRNQLCDCPVRRRASNLAAQNSHVDLVNSNVARAKRDLIDGFLRGEQRCIAIDVVSGVRRWYDAAIHHSVNAGHAA